MVDGDRQEGLHRPTGLFIHDPRFGQNDQTFWSRRPKGLVLETNQVGLGLPARGFLPTLQPVDDDPQPGRKRPEKTLQVKHKK